VSFWGRFRTVEVSDTVSAGDCGACKPLDWGLESVRLLSSLSRVGGRCKFDGPATAGLEVLSAGLVSLSVSTSSFMRLEYVSR
jgi:hypothetical protein